ncbi:hypothetical protein Pst134EB_001808 [Puccinia striiformis f. sp. tritici]|nr:hypothetical protein Pst134EB_001808 [Puccinia striiformis f. sp. tritici]
MHSQMFMCPIAGICWTESTSVDRGVRGPVGKFKLRHRRQGDSIIVGFEKLMKKLDEPAHLETPAAFSVDERNSNDFLFNYLHSSLLPALCDQLASLSLALDPLDLWNDPDSKIKLIFELQSGLDHNITELKYIIAVLFPQPSTNSSRTDDHQLKEWKFYRINELRSKIVDVVFEINTSLHSAHLHIYHIRLSTDPQEENDEGAYEAGIEEALDVIKSTMTWCKGSELDIAEEYWRNNLFRIDNLLRETFNLVDQTVYPTHHYMNEKRKFVLQPVIQLTKFLMTIIKLCRLFFKKLSKRGMNQSQLPLHTDMNSKQIKCLCELAGNVYADIVKIILLFRNVEMAHTVRSQKLIDIADRLVHRFETPLLLVTLHLVPLIPQTNGLSEQNYYRKWFATWHTQIIVALHNFNRFAATFDHIHF